MDPITIQTDELIKWGTFGLKAATPLLAWLVPWRVGKWFFGKVRNRRFAKRQAILDKNLYKTKETLTKAEKAFGNSLWAELYDHVRYARDISLKEALIFEFCKKNRKNDMRPLSVCGADLFLDLLKEKTVGYNFQKVSNELAKFIIPKAQRERKYKSRTDKHKGKKCELSGEALRSYYNSGGFTAVNDPIKYASINTQSQGSNVGDYVVSPKRRSSKHYDAWRKAIVNKDGKYMQNVKSHPNVKNIHPGTIL